MDNILSLDELKSRISDYYTEKKAADMPPEQDPQETTPPNFVKDDGDDASKMVVPDAAVSATNTDGSAENNIPGMSSGEASGKEPGKTETTDVTVTSSSPSSLVVASIAVCKDLQAAINDDSAIAPVFIDCLRSSH